VKKLLIVLVVLLLGGGAAGWWFWLREPEAAPSQSVDQTAIFLPIPAIKVPIIRGNTVVAAIVIDLAFEVHGEERRAQLQNRMPYVIDAMTVELFELMRFRFMEDRGYDATLIKRHVKRAIEKAGGPDLVAEVLIRSIHSSE
jgi:flagellar basal body-associated protein FliL